MIIKNVSDTSYDNFDIVVKLNTHLDKHIMSNIILCQHTFIEVMP